jgi:hypothetical protein
MSIYNPGIPLPNDDLSDSQGQILQNFQVANSSFGIDHYPFADQSVNQGKHNQITTPAFVDNPPTGLPPVTIANEPKIYAYQDSSQLGVINYSRGPLNAVPTPLTHLQSSALPLVIAANGTINVMDFTNLNYALGILYAVDTTNLNATRLIYYFTWSKPFIAFSLNSLLPTLGPTSFFSAQAFGSILQIKNNDTVNAYNNVAWTLQFDRIWS